LREIASLFIFYVYGFSRQPAISRFVSNLYWIIQIRISFRVQDLLCDSDFCSHGIVILEVMPMRQGAFRLPILPMIPLRRKGRHALRLGIGGRDRLTTVQIRIESGKMNRLVTFSGVAMATVVTVEQVGNQFVIVGTYPQEKDNGSRVGMAKEYWGRDARGWMTWYQGMDVAGLALTFDTFQAADAYMDANKKRMEFSETDLVSLPS
jgi:hypothetical protein